MFNIISYQENEIKITIRLKTHLEFRIAKIRKIDKTKNWQECGDTGIFTGRKNGITKLPKVTLKFSESNTSSPYNSEILFIGIQTNTNYYTIGITILAITASSQALIMTQGSMNR